MSTRRVDDLVQAMGLSGISKSQVAKLCKDIDERVHAFLDRPLAGEWPYLWLDATYLKQREGGRIVSVAAIIAVAVNTDGKREQLRQKWPKLAASIDDSETDVLSHLDFPEQHRSKLHSTSPLERLNKEVKRRADVVGIFPNEASIIREIASRRSLLADGECLTAEAEA